MADLEATLATVRERIAKYRRPGIGEQNTKATLIVPILRALGWDAGELKPGMLADFVELRPRLTLDAAGLVFGPSASDVTTVVVGGKTVVSA